METLLSPSVPRRRAAEIIGVSTGTLRNWAAAKPPRGPTPIRLGTSRQARVLYTLAEIERWRADLAGYRWPANASQQQRTRNERHR